MSWLESAASPRFLDALDFAVRVHGKDRRKGTQIPYVAHLLSVCALVISDGGTEEDAVAALLHDTLEDHPEDVSRRDLSERFGDRVLAIVEACTDTPSSYAGGPKPPWRERKLAYIEHLKRADSGELRVAFADKLDNVRSMLADYRQIGEALWHRFNAGKDDQLWFLRSLVVANQVADRPGYLFIEFRSTVAELERLAAST
jgi:(p)ppGpp synthase/HD superfamily hydrolase